MDARLLAQGAVEHGAYQKVEEFARLVGLVDSRLPRVILEVGSARGGTLWAWAQIAPRVVAIDLPSGPYGGEPQGPPSWGATLVLGDSRDPSVRLRAWQATGGPVDFAFIDGDHTYEGVLSDYRNFAPWVRPGGLLAFHDVCEHPGMPDVGVPRLWAELKAGDPSAVVLEAIAEPRTWGGIGVLRRR